MEKKTRRFKTLSNTIYNFSSKWYSYILTKAEFLKKIRVLFEPKTFYMFLYGKKKLNHLWLLSNNKFSHFTILLPVLHQSLFFILTIFILYRLMLLLAFDIFNAPFLWSFFILLVIVSIWILRHFYIYEKKY